MKIEYTSKEDEDFSDYLNKHGLYARPIYELQAAIEYIRSEYSPEDIFDVDKLHYWAVKSEYIKL